MTLPSLRARPFDLPLKRPIETAAGIMTTSPIVLVDLLTEEGVTGHAYVRSCTPLALDPLARLIATAAVYSRSLTGALGRRRWRTAVARRLSVSKITGSSR
jgi:hypothetical protein